jgi:hypothetical protein
MLGRLSPPASDVKLPYFSPTNLSSQGTPRAEGPCTRGKKWVKCQNSAGKGRRDVPYVNGLERHGGNCRFFETERLTVS